MGITATIQSKVANAFNTSLADAVKQFVLISGDTYHYNVYTGVMESVGIQKNNWRGVFDGETKAVTVDGAEQPIDSQITALANEAPFEPKVNDLIIKQNECFRIVARENDPADATWILSVRSASSGNQS